MKLLLLDDSLEVEVSYDAHERGDEDSVCLVFAEHCPQAERLFQADETRVFLTPEQAEPRASALVHAAAASRLAG